jgi:hypothetical protein
LLHFQKLRGLREAGQDFIVEPQMVAMALHRRPGGCRGESGLVGHEAGRLFGMVGGIPLGLLQGAKESPEGFGYSQAPKSRPRIRLLGNECISRDILLEASDEFNILGI